MHQRISGKDVEVRLPSGQRILFDQVNLNLDDGIVATHDQGYPNGWVRGEVKGDGDLQVPTETLLALNNEAALAGSWEEMPAFDITFYAKVGTVELDVRAHGCKLRMPNFPFDGKGGDKVMHTINFVVSSPDFVHLNGVPLAQRIAQ